MTKDKYQLLPTLHLADEIKKRHIKKNIKCIIFGNFGAMNIGDEAILAGEIQQLQQIPNISITVVGRYPKEIKRLHKVNAVSLYTLHEIRKEIKKADFVIVGGGGLINKVERNIIGFFYQLYMLLVFFFLPRMYKKKLYITGIGIYDNANKFIITIALIFFKQASLISVRDHHSQDFLKKKNVHSHLYKDNSFLMELTPITQVQEEPFFKQHYRKDRMNIGISLVNPENKKTEKKLTNELFKFIKKYNEKADFWIYATDNNPEYINDHKFSKKVITQIKNQLKEDFIFHVVPIDSKPQTYFSSIKLMNFMVATRFHAQIFAYRNRIPFAGISYDKKCASFIESIGMKSIPLHSVSAEAINKHVL